MSISPVPVYEDKNKALKGSTQTKEMMKSIYLDNAATTRPLDTVTKTLADSMQKHWGNPSSLHRRGVDAAMELSKARKKIADFAGLPAKWLTFTSGATEANQSIILGNLIKPHKNRNHVLLSSFEHPSVGMAIEPLKNRGFDVELIAPDSIGLISPESVTEKMKSRTAFVSLIGVHNEMGVKQDIVAIFHAIKKKNPETLFHVDGVQWFAKFPLPNAENMPDFLTFSAHKFNGPRGIGGFFKRPSVSFTPLILGGGQERGLRSGTENIPAIVGIAKSLENHNIKKTHEHALELQEKLFELITSKTSLQWLGPPPGSDRSPYVSLFSVIGKKSEIMIHEFEDLNIFLSSGSACSEKKKTKKTIWDTFHYPDELRQGLLRVSTGRTTTVEEFDLFLNELNHRS